MRVTGRILIEEAIRVLQSVLAQSTVENANTRFILAPVGGCWQKFQPDRIQPEPAQSKHPLERHGVIAAALRIFRRKPAAEKDGHGHRIVCSRLRSSARCPLKSHGNPLNWIFAIGPRFVAES